MGDILEGGLTDSLNGFMGGNGGYSLQGGTAKSGNSSGDRNNAQTVYFGNTGTNQNNNQMLMLGGFALIALLLLKK